MNNTSQPPYALFNRPLMFNPYQYEPYFKWQSQESREKRLYIADQVGLGKTIETGIILLEEIKTAEREGKKNPFILIIAPTFLCSQWQEQLNTLFYLPSVILNSQKLKKIGEGLHGTPSLKNCYILPLSQISKYENFHSCLCNHERETFLVLDEAHYLRNSSSCRYESMKGMMKFFTNRIFLSATPINNEGSDYNNQRNLLEPNTSESAIYTCATRKKEAFPSIPEREIRVVSVEFTEEEQAFYQTSYSTGNTKGASVILRHIAASSLTALMRCYERYEQKQRDILKELEGFDEFDEFEEADFTLKLEEKYNLPTEDSKFEALMDLLSENFADHTAPKKIVIFAHYIETCKMLKSSLQEYFAEEETAVYMLTGSMTKTAQNKEKVGFRDSNSPSILVCSDVCKEGVNLQFASVLINYDLPFNPAILEQRIGRIDRVGQTEEIEIYHFIVKGSYDDRLYFEILMDKLNLINFYGKSGVLIPLDVTDNGKQQWDDSVESALESIGKNKEELENLLEKIEFNLKKLNQDLNQKYQGTKAEDTLSDEELMHLCREKATEYWDLWSKNNKAEEGSQTLEEQFHEKNADFWGKFGVEKVEDWLKERLDDSSLKKTWSNCTKEEWDERTEKVKSVINQYQGEKRPIIQNLLKEDVVRKIKETQIIPDWTTEMIREDISYDFSFLQTQHTDLDFEDYKEKFLPLELVVEILG